MSITQFKILVVFFLVQHKSAWKENGALRSMLASVPMSDGTKGIPQREQTLAEYLADKEMEAAAQQRFAPMANLLEVLLCAL